MSTTIKLRKGLNIRLKGKAEKVLLKSEIQKNFAIKPTDFAGITPKMLVKAGDKVKAGSPLFYDKANPDAMFTSPVSGVVDTIVRGDRRKILEVVINADQETEYETFKKANPLELSKEEIIENLLKSGTWPLIRQMPYSIIANPKDKPKAIFISTFNSSPLAPDYDFVVKNEEKTFQNGINALSKLSAKIHLNINNDDVPSKFFSEIGNVEHNFFKGPHPSGNPSIQIHHIDPVNKGDIVWFIDALDVLLIGRLFDKGTYDASKIVAITGSEVKRPRYCKVIAGTSIEPLINNNLKEDNVRCISGNVLTGTKIFKNGYLGFYDWQLTIVPEGNKFELLGWALPGLKKFSVSRSFFSWLSSKKEYQINTNLNGGQRAIVMSGQYQKVVPMDILPVFLLKAILAEDVEKMENLGIYEVSEADFALCDFVCTSKIEAQAIIRKGIELMIKEMG